MADSSDAPSQLQEATQEDLDASMDAGINLESTTQQDSMNIDGANESTQADPLGVGAESSEPRIPVKKDATLREFLNKMDDYAPIIPDAVTNYYMTLAGLPPPPQTSPHLSRLLALATQKFIADIAADAYQYARIRASNSASSNVLGALPGALPGGAAAAPGAAGSAAAPVAKDAPGKGLNLGVQRPGFGGGGQGGGQGRTVLTMEDLGMAVGEYGVNVKRGEFYR